jgi:sulfide:quinone oxidoreductase
VDDLTRVKKVEAGKMTVEEVNEDGSVKAEKDLPFAFSMMLPAFRGIKAVRGIEGLSNPRGFTIVDKHQRNPKYKNIFAVGVCVAIPPMGPTPVPCGVPKTGFMIESMVTATAHNIGNLLRGKEPDSVGTWNAVCLADFGDGGIAFVASRRSRRATSTGRRRANGCIWPRSGSRNTSCASCARASRANPSTKAWR